MGILRYECEIEYLSDSDREREEEERGKRGERGATVEQIVQKAASANDRA